ncbi:MAG TPA: Uma2 family endonuclease [Polyangiaceae bacterium]|nr:Uma2 family endonuclease [Polyangiaceae bacterium]
MTQPSEPMQPVGSSQLVTDDGEPMETARHRQQMTVLIESLEHAWRDRDDFYVGGNMFLYFSETQTRRNDFRGPDVFVVMNTTRRERKAWVVWEEGGQAPDVVVELLSEKTEKVDRGEKMRVYARALRVAEYFLFDPFSGVFEGYALDPLKAQYVPKHPDELGRLRCERLGLLLAPMQSTLWSVDARWLRWLDESGRVLPLPSESAMQAEIRANSAEDRARGAEARASSAEARASSAEAHASSANERIASLEAQLSMLKSR